MLRFAAVLLLAASPLIASRALAQPTQASADPVAQGQPPATPGDRAAEIEPEEPWVPPPPTPGDVRGLPPCPPGTPPTPAGEQHTCRPEMAEPGLQMALPIELATGGLFADTPLQHSAISVAAGLDVGLSRSVALGARWRFLGGGEAFSDLDTDNDDDTETGYYGSHLVGGGPRLRLWTDETAREAWLLELDGGWSFTPNHPDLAGPFATVSVGRQVGVWVGQTGAAQAALVLSYTHGFAGAEELRAVLFGVRLHPEWGIPLPLDVDEVPVPSSLAHTLGVQFGLFGLQLGGEGGAAMAPSLGLAVGFPVTRALEPRVLVDMSRFGTFQQRPSPLVYTGLGGLRLRLSDYLPAFLDVMAGWQLVTDHRPRDFDGGAVVDLATGLYFAGCGLGGALGLRYRQGLLERNEEYRALSLFVEMTWGNRRGALGAEPWPSGEPAGWSCGGGYSPGYAATPPPPPPEPEPAPAGAELEAGGGGRVDLHVPEVEARAEVDVEVEVEPVVVEVTLGVSLFGGAVRLEIDPGSLPLRQIRDSGFVSVEIVGPPAALARAEAELRGTLGPEGASVDAWTRTATERLDVRAIFTLWPPGSRPPAR